MRKIQTQYMTARNLLQQVLPPVVRRLSRSVLSGVIGFTRAKSWQDAASRSAGYEDDLVISTSARPSTPQPSESVSGRELQVLAALFVGLPSESGAAVRVLDVGGARGELFYLVRRMRPDLRLDWTVLETPKFTRLMTPVTSGDSHLRWIENFEPKPLQYDLAILSSVLQYLEDPGSTLMKAAVAARMLLINRIPLIQDNEDVPTVQHLRMYGHRGSYPAWFFSEERFIDRVVELGRIRYRWLVPEDTHILGTREVVCQGLLLDTNQHDQT